MTATLSAGGAGGYTPGAPAKKKSRRIDGYLLCFLALTAAQVVAWKGFSHIRPDFIIVPEPPAGRSVKAYALGDDAFYFRRLVFALQNAGDTFGRFTALREYDYGKLQQWFFLADALDAKSNAVPLIAGYYYSQTQNVPDTRYVVDYLVRHADRDPAHKWWWYAQASHLANHRLEDKKLASDIALKITAIPMEGDGANIPLWARQLPAFIYEKMGAFEESLQIMEQVQRDLENNNRELTEGEANFLRHFFIHRIQKPEAELMKKLGKGIYADDAQPPPASDE